MCIYYTEKVFAALPTAERGKPVKITGDPKGENFLYCNGQSIFIRNIQVRSSFIFSFDMFYIYYMHIPQDFPKSLLGYILICQRELKPYLCFLFLE